MVKMVRITLLLLAALFLARGPIVYGGEPLSGHLHQSHAELALHSGHEPIHFYRPDKACSKAGCALAGCQLQMPAAAILPYAPPLNPPHTGPTFAICDDATLLSLRRGPPCPPPKFRWLDSLIVPRAA